MTDQSIRYIQSLSGPTPRDPPKHLVSNENGDFTGQDLIKLYFNLTLPMMLTEY